MPVDQDHCPTPQAGDARWVREALAHWGHSWTNAAPHPLRGPQGDPPLSHTAGLWSLTHDGTPYLFKGQLEPDAVRSPLFPALKQQTMAHCAARGIPLAEAVATADGEPAAWHDGRLCEVIPLAPGAAVGDPSPQQAAAVVTTGLALRAALDEVPAALAGQLAAVPLPELVEEADWGRALVEARTRLLPAARRRTDAWGRAAARALTALLDAEPLLRAASRALSAPPARRAVIHSDLHYHHFLLGTAPGPLAHRVRVTAVLDFDNLHVGDRLLDLAWVAEISGRVSGGPDGVRAALGHFRTTARRAGLLADEHLPLLMPVLVAHAAPVVVDIAKDILERGILLPAWLSYFELLDTERRSRLHRLLTS